MPLLYATKVALVASQLIMLNPRLCGRGPAQRADESMDSTAHYTGCVEYPLNLLVLGTMHTCLWLTGQPYFKSDASLQYANRPLLLGR